MSKVLKINLEQTNKCLIRAEITAFIPIEHSFSTKLLFINIFNHSFYFVIENLFSVLSHFFHTHTHTHTHTWNLEVRYPLDSRCTED